MIEQVDNQLILPGEYIPIQKNAGMAGLGAKKSRKPIFTDFFEGVDQFTAEEESKVSHGTTDDQVNHVKRRP